MSSVVRGFVEGIGITDCLPRCFKYFTQLTIPETIIIPEQKPDAEQLMSITVEPEIISTRVVRTAFGTSWEGQHLAGCKLIIELKLRQKIKYVADNAVQSVHAVHVEKFISSIFVVLPCIIDGMTVEELLRRKKLIITPCIEDVYGAMIDKRTFFKNVAVLINVTTTNRPPVVPDYTVTTTAGTPVSGQVVGTDPDGDTLTYSILTQPQHGTATINSATGEWTYTPNNAFFKGVDSFEVLVSDGKLCGEAVSTVTVTVTA